MKTFSVIFLVGTMAQCGHPEIKVDSACAVLKKTLYEDGRFSFTGDEIDHLSEKNQIKVVAVKDFYKNNCLKKP